jgi:STE24 endopeptidase
VEVFYAGFGFSHPSNYAALVIFGLGASALSFLLTPFFSMLSRKFEYDADQFAIEVLDRPETMSEVIALLTKENLSNINPHPWYSFFHYSHPAPVERVRAIEKALSNLSPKGDA